MKIRIVCYEDVHQWIIGKFALRMQEHLLQLGHEVSIDKTVDEDADVNHHLIYLGYKNQQIKGIQTLMITHVDSTSKLRLLKRQSKIAAMGICMSRETMEMLVNLGIQRDWLSYINPAHDGIIKPKKLSVGITCRVQHDGRKRENFLKRLINYISPHDFCFRIMGDGWDEQVASLRSNGFEVEYWDHFIYEKYIELIPALDYYLYMGLDEGQMGFVDAVATGVKTIVTLQGYHLDALEGITHGFKTFNELAAVFTEIAAARNRSIGSVGSWNWHDYTIKHLNIWNYLLAESDQRKTVWQQVPYKDGIASLEEFDTKQVKLSAFKAINDYWAIRLGKLKHSYYKRRSIRKGKRE